MTTDSGTRNVGADAHAHMQRYMMHVCMRTHLGEEQDCHCSDMHDPVGRSAGHDQPVTRMMIYTAPR